MGETIGVNVLKRASNMEVSEQFDGYSLVRIFVGTDDDGNSIIYEAGNPNGRALEIKNPFGTQEMAENILADINGYQYQPMSADNALLDPAAEMGDGVTVNGVYSGVFVRATQFGRLMASDISAPTDEEIEHEFAIESASDRQYTRFVQQTKAMLKITNMAIEAEVAARTEADENINATLAIHATDIQARVTKQSPSGQTSFGWNLTDSEWTVFSGSPSNVILRASSSGLQVKGRIEADEGYIGGANGFIITANKIYKNISKFGGTQSTGVYIGTDGIQLGKNFKVDSGGNLTATSGAFGSLSVANNGNTVGGYYGNLSGCGGSVSGGLALGGTGYTASSLANRVNAIYADYINTNNLVAKIATAGTVRIASLILNGNYVTLNTEAWYDLEGNFHRIYYWGI